MSPEAVARFIRNGPSGSESGKRSFVRPEQNSVMQNTTLVNKICPLDRTVPCFVSERDQHQSVFVNAQISQDLRMQSGHFSTFEVNFFYFGSICAPYSYRCHGHQREDVNHEVIRWYLQGRESAELLRWTA